MEAPSEAFGSSSSSSGGRKGGRNGRLASLAVLAAASVAIGHLRSEGFCAPAQVWSSRQVRQPGPTARSAELIKRPEKGPAWMLKVPYYQQPHVPDGATRREGPIRALYFSKSFKETLESGSDEEGQGGLRGRYGTEIAEHLQERKDLVASGIRENITVFWDVASTGYSENDYRQTAMKIMDRTLHWLAGMLDATVTRVESVETTRYAAMSQNEFLSGEVNWYRTLRQMGCVVHRTWPPISLGKEAIVFERFRHHLDLMQNGSQKSILVVVSRDKGHAGMLESAQSEGVTVVHITPTKRAWYYPGGHDFSVPIVFPRWERIMTELFSPKLDPLRPEEEWLPRHGPKRWNSGPIDLDRAGKTEELDRRIFHSWIDRKDFDGRGANFMGDWVRPGLRLNATLQQAFEKATQRSGTGFRGGPPSAKAEDAFRRDMEALQNLEEEDYAALFWNYESHPLKNQGPSQTEMLGRIVRWFSGFVGMSVKRAEVSKFVEPWDALGAGPMDWLRSMADLDFVIHRVWPPRDEATNRALTRSVGAIAKAKSANRWGGDRDRPPRLVVVLSEDLCFDQAMEDAQDAGISALWIGRNSHAVFYVANSHEKVAIRTNLWDVIVKDLSIANNNPFDEGVSTPDAPMALTEWQGQQVPKDTKWGLPQKLGLDPSQTFLSPEDLKESKLDARLNA
mmetsp:Transcript_78926/g.142365  ORF Transcript_78926/g.142365 Transcript_78926/m.142365 type:complete len:679 (+) Transcript_78926:89-2125(+)